MGDGDNIVPAKPVEVVLAGDADDRRAGALGELYGEASDAAGCGRHRDGLASRGSDGTYGRECGRADDEQRAGDLPRNFRRAAGHMAGLDEHELGVAGATLGPADHLVADLEVADAV